AGSGRSVQENDFVLRLNDLRGATHAGHTVRLTLEEGIDSVRISIQVLNLVPELRLIERPVGIHSPGELAIHGLIRLIVASFLVRSTSTRSDIGRDVAVVLRRTIDAGRRSVPHAAQVGMLGDLE